MTDLFKLFTVVFLLSPLKIAAQQTPTDGEQPIPTKSVIQLESTIRGSREQPKVMSIVPWQPPTDKQSLPSPVLRRINEQFQALNRAEFRRGLEYYEKLSQK